jgi:NitT/TauT family transport system substrate-binding protein
MSLRRLLVAACVLALLALPLGCAADEEPAPEAPAGEKPLADVEPAPIKIGTLPTEDSLPLWVAAQEGLFAEAGLEVEIVVFQAAQERDTAFASGAIDAYMGDIIASANLEAAGSPVMLATVMLGQTAEEGRFGIVAAPGSTAASLEDLAGVPIGTSSASIQEYVVDRMMDAAGVPADDVAKEIVPKVPVRYDLLMNGQLKAAALPEPFLSLAKLEGATVIADDTTGGNITQTVLGVSDEYLALPAGLVTVRELLGVWNEAAGLINADPDVYRALLVEQARLPEPLADTYEVNTYPQAAAPTPEMVDPVLAWMAEKGLLTADVTYGDLVMDIAE